MPWQRSARALKWPTCPWGAKTAAPDIEIMLMGYWHRHRRAADSICNLITKNQSKIENKARICYFVTK